MAAVKEDPDGWFLDARSQRPESWLSALGSSANSGVGKPPPMPSCDDEDRVAPKIGAEITRFTPYIGACYVSNPESFKSRPSADLAPMSSPAERLLFGALNCVHTGFVAGAVLLVFVPVGHTPVSWAAVFLLFASVFGTLTAVGLLIFFQDRQSAVAFFLGLLACLASLSSLIVIALRWMVINMP